MKYYNFSQKEFDIKCEWGESGLRHFILNCDLIIIIDILSFSTAVDIAASRGAIIFPYSSKGESAEKFARSRGALLAGDTDVPYRLSPVTLLEIPPETRLVLPSPNGSALSCLTGDMPTMTACLRNAAAVAKAAPAIGRRIGVVPAGERWPDGSLRPAIEDLIGAGAVIQALTGSRSQEAELAVAAFERFQDNLYETLGKCSSGEELIDRGRQLDLELAAALNCSQTVPCLHDGSYY